MHNTLFVAMLVFFHYHLATMACPGTSKCGVCNQLTGKWEVFEQYEQFMESNCSHGKKTVDKIHVESQQNNIRITSNNNLFF